MGKIEPMLKFKYSAKDNLYTMDLRRDVRPKDFKTMTFKPNISSKFIKRYNKFLIKEECLRRGVEPKDLLVAPEKVIDVNVYIMLTKYGQMNREVGTSLRDMYVDDMLKYASRYKDEEKPMSAIGVTYDLRRGPQKQKSLGRALRDAIRDARIKNYAKETGSKGIGFSEVIKPKNLRLVSIKRFLRPRKQKMSYAEKAVLEFNQKQEKMAARAAAKTKRRPIYDKEDR